MSPAAAAPGGGERRRPIASARDCRGRGWGCGGAALLGLSLLGLVLYLVPAAAALAWLAVGATAAWWGLSREPRGSRAFSSLVRNARRQRILFTPSPAKSAVNGNLLEPRTPLQGPDPAELLLMGSYQGKPGPPQPAPVPEARNVRERQTRLLPTRTSPPPGYSVHRVHHIHSSHPTPLFGPSRRPTHRDCGTLSNRFLITPRRQYPIQQAQYSFLGVLPTVSWNGYHKKTVLSPHNSKMVCSPVTVRIAPPDSKLTRSPITEQLISSTLSSPSSNAPDPCAKETVLSALKERKKRTVEEEEQIVSDGQENKRRPGSLKRGLNSQSSDDHLNKRSRTSSMSSMTSTYTGGILSSSRNAITSSYSSTRGFSQLWKRSGPSSSPFSSPASSRSQTPERPAKKIREEELSHHSSPSTPLVTDKESQGERVVDTTTWKKQNLRNSPSTPGSSGQRKRKIQLLPSRRGDQLTLPPPPQLGYSITAEDLDLEKKASLRWFNQVLEDKTDAASSSVTENPPTTQPFTFTLPTSGTAPSPTSLPAPSTNPLLESLRKMQDSPGLTSFPDDSAGVAIPAAHSPPKTPSLLGPPSSSQSTPLPGTSSDSKPTISFLGLSPTSVPVTDTTKSPQAETSAPSQALSAPAPSPKPSLLFGMLSTPPANPSASASPAVSSASPMFKPIFQAPPKSENEGPLPYSPSKVTTTASFSSTLPTTTSTSPIPFKPLFGNMGPSTSVSLPTPFSFNQTPTTATTTNAPLFTGQASATSTVASVTTASTSTDSASKPTFGFGVSNVTSTMNSTTSTTTSTSQPFLFGNPPASGASFTPAIGPIFQFGKLSAIPTSTTTTTTTTFGQSLPGAVQAATSSSTTGFSGFGSTLTTSAPVTTSQPTLTFSSSTTPTFNIPFGSSTKAPLPSYPGTNPQPFGATDGQQQGATKPTLAPSFGNSFTFGNSAASAPTATPAPTPPQPAFGNTAQPAFGGLKPTASAFGTPASTQPAFGSTTAAFSFGAATTSGFGATTQTTSSGTSSSVFGSTAPSPFTFGGSAAPAGSGGFGINVATPGTSSTSGAFNFGGGQSGTTGNTAPFGGGLSQNTLGAPSQSTPFAFNVASTPESKPVFGGTSTPTFGQNTPAPGVGTSGSSLSFGASSTPTQGFVGVGPFGSAAPSFSIGAGSKTPGARQRLQARRQHTRKK
ncbi:nuclear envelope pore membrane protein POM 121C isoform X3 [Pipistrellus kuhlii]|uniref:nuclear envelope pore membrane protein POM 121C isoform X3 n=1 Tax=Pipistrellus kuhlii TaxID=59472 RepID=UPI00174F3F68|nr:nuclear envelope pore membrane protein POM 121C isoform X3 [Pipistrellus kuhlii]